MGIIINYYILLTPSYNKQEMKIVYMWDAVSVGPSTGSASCLFEYIIGGNMAPR